MALLALPVLIFLFLPFRLLHRSRSIPLVSFSKLSHAYESCFLPSSQAFEKSIRSSEHLFLSLSVTFSHQSGAFQLRLEVNLHVDQLFRTIQENDLLDWKAGRSKSSTIPFLFSDQVAASSFISGLAITMSFLPFSVVRSILLLFFFFPSKLILYYPLSSSLVLLSISHYFRCLVR